MSVTHLADVGSDLDLRLLTLAEVEVVLAMIVARLLGGAGRLLGGGVVECRRRRSFRHGGRRRRPQRGGRATRHYNGMMSLLSLLLQRCTFLIVRGNWNRGPHRTRALIALMTSW